MIGLWWSGELNKNILLDFLLIRNKKRFVMTRHSMAAILFRHHFVAFIDMQMKESISAVAIFVKDLNRSERVIFSFRSPSRWWVQESFKNPSRIPLPLPE